MRIGFNRMHYPVTTLGFGRRIGIWVQGCSIGCTGCISRDTWASSAEMFVDVAELLDRCAAIDKPVDGVTISGGEPFEQPEALAALLDGLDAWRHRIGREIDLLAYSGLGWKRLQRMHPAILARLDAVIPEPFAEAHPTEAAWRGSSNQPLVLLTPLGEGRYSSEPRVGDAPPRMQVAVQQGQVWFIGVPRRGDMDRLIEASGARGVVMGGASWRA